MTLFYLLDATPGQNPGETTNSVAIPAGVTGEQDFGITSKVLSSITKGSAAANHSGNSLADANENGDFFSSWNTIRLPAQTFTAETWNFGLLAGGGNSAAQSFFALSVYTFTDNPSPAVVDFIYDSDAELGALWHNALRGRLGSFSGAASTIKTGDWLVVELWRHTLGQTMSMAYNQQVEVGAGGADVTEDSAGGTAPWISTPYTVDEQIVGEPGALAAKYRQRALSIARM